MRAVYSLTLRQLSGRWRIISMAVLALLPVIVATIVLRDSSAPEVAEFEKFVLNTLLAGSIAPLVVLAIAIAAFGNEREDRTLANLMLTPLPRWQIVLPKLFAVITIATPFVAVSTALTTHVAFMGDTRATVAATVSAVVGVLLYSAAFLWLGLVSSQAIGLGLLYIVLWEGLFAGFVAGVRLLSIRYHALTTMHTIDPRRFAEGQHLGPVPVVVISILLFSGFIWLTIRHLRRMDVA